MEKMFSFEKPTCELVKNYNDLFKSDDSKDGLKDNAIFKLFELMPDNNIEEQVIVKVATLNSLYSTYINGNDLVKVARIIVDLNIDDYIKGDDVDIKIVNTIAYDNGTYSNGLYSFASKYCSFHNPTKFPIVDGYSKGMLYYMNNSKFKFTDKFSQKDLNDYLIYYKIYTSFIKCFGLDSFSFKELDRFLWKYAKERETKYGEKIYVDCTEHSN